MSKLMTAQVKKINNFLFDVTVGSYDGAETCELAGLYLLNQLNTVIDKSGDGLYRRDGLIIHYSTSTAFLTTHQQSSNSCLKCSAREFQIYSIIYSEEFNKVKSFY